MWHSLHRRAPAALHRLQMLTALHRLQAYRLITRANAAEVPDQTYMYVQLSSTDRWYDF
jgi:hypothetical protein